MSRIGLPLVRPALIVLVATVALAVGATSCTPRTPATQVTVRIWQTETDREAVAILDSTCRAFERAHEGVHLELESVPWSALAEKLTAAIQSGNEPDLAHVEPFMVGSLIDRDRLVAIDDVIDAVEVQNGPILPCVRDLQLYSGKHYGLAYAVGVTGFAYRRDLAEARHLKSPQTWSEYVRFVRAIDTPAGKAPLILPGGDPFFIDQLFAELVANNGGVLFDGRTHQPRFTDHQVVECLQFLASLRPDIDPTWQTQTYLDQFNRLARGLAANAPVTYVRATKAFEKNAAEAPSGAGVVPADTAHFGLLPQPAGPSLPAGQPTVATIDCEPYVVFRQAEWRRAGKYGTNADLAKEFLKQFYARPQYARFCRAVPIHLTPIFARVAASSPYADAPLIQRWRPWAERCRVALQSGQVRPILMPDSSSKDLPFLLEVQSSRIISNMVAAVLDGKATPIEAAKRGQADATELLARLTK